MTRYSPVQRSSKSRTHLHQFSLYLTLFAPSTILAQNGQSPSAITPTVPQPLEPELRLAALLHPTSVILPCPICQMNSQLPCQTSTSRQSPQVIKTRIRIMFPWPVSTMLPLPHPPIEDGIQVTSRLTLDPFLLSNPPAGPPTIIPYGQILKTKVTTKTISTLLAQTPCRCLTLSTLLHQLPALLFYPPSLTPQQLALLHLGVLLS